MTPAPVNPDVIEAVRKHDAGAAKQVEAMAGHVRQLADTVMARMVEVWSADALKDPEDLRRQTAFVGGIRQIFTLTKRIVRVFSNEPGGASGTPAQ